MANAWEIEQLTVSAQGRTLVSLGGLTVPRGQLLVLIGPNGAGKSSLLRAMAGFAGQCRGRLLGRAMGGKGYPYGLLSWVAQHETGDSPLSVADYLMLGRRPALGLLRLPDAADHRRVAEAMQVMELTPLAAQRVSRLSGGERQRAAIARALVQDAPCMLLDEPSNHLDIRHQNLLMQHLKQLTGQGRTVVCVLHDLQLAANHADQLWLLADGVLRCRGTPPEVLTHPVLAEAYRWPIQAVAGAGAGQGWSIVSNPQAGSGMAARG
ncbi:ABC transporter ATP-binding protein [Aquitalea sp. LB_tupeE]|uniref:ABC transporter ATP-binding protein n=1 Tax=Aquitalea sp. LB_tupeE TaxID=2748078 RepID=UPI0015BA2FBD|nr:ABC transporter ATP-binding protein [Aquitalea sp. LB_tupeE]